MDSAAECVEIGGIAQLGERLNGIQEVSGSIPLISTRKGLENTVFSRPFCHSYRKGLTYKAVSAWIASRVPYNLIRTLSPAQTRSGALRCVRHAATTEFPRRAGSGCVCPISSVSDHFRLGFSYKRRFKSAIGTRLRRNCDGILQGRLKPDGGPAFSRRHSRRRNTIKRGFRMDPF